MKVVMTDPSACTGCRSCEITCASVKESTPNHLFSRIRVLVSMQALESYLFYPQVCLQCEMPYCALVCAPAALQKSSDTGVVELFAERCIGCKLCLIACPFGAITMHDKLPSKCDLCGGDPQCVKACTFGALSFGEPEDLAQSKRLVLSRAMREGRSLPRIKRQPI